MAIVCLDDPEVQKLIPYIEKRFVTYGVSSQAMIRGVKPRFEGKTSHFSVFKEDEHLGDITLPMPGFHNILDALATIATADIFEIPFDQTKEALEAFPGVQRRFTERGKAAGVTVIDDYGHHPTEIKAVLQAARQIAGGRVAVLFQPHRYTRTQALFEEFLTSFFDADLLYILDIYPASEKPIEGITGDALCDGIRSRGHKTVKFITDQEAVADVICQDVRPNDMIITLGAGDVTHIGPVILEELRKRESSIG